tara:strand:+ start:70 stop:306 length:237 start_codon:yes stop_codon:yes gene_type:complete
MKNDSVQNLKDWFVFIVALISCIVGVIFWVQSANDSDITRIEAQIQSLRDDIDTIRENNNEILRIVGRLEGKIDHIDH